MMRTGRHVLRGGGGYQPVMPLPAYPMPFVPFDPFTPTTVGPITVTQVPQTVNLVLYRGDSVNLSIQVNDGAGAPFNLTGWVARAQIRARADDPDPALAEWQISMASPTSGVLSLYLAPQDSADLGVLAAVWDLQLSQGLSQSSTPTVVTIAAGTVNFTADVTRPT
jgi:hypothetical protein